MNWTVLWSAPRATEAGRHFGTQLVHGAVRLAPVRFGCASKTSPTSTPLPDLLVVGPGLYCFGSATWNLSLPVGVVRFLRDEAEGSVFVTQRIVYASEGSDDWGFLTLMACVGSLLPYGHNMRWDRITESGCGGVACERAFERQVMREEFSLQVDCGPITWFCDYVARTYTRVPVRLVFTFVSPWLQNPDGHDALEAYVDLSKGGATGAPGRKWTFVDVDQRVFAVDYEFRPLNALEMMRGVAFDRHCRRAIHAYRLRPLTRDANFDPASGRRFYRRYMSGAVGVVGSLLEGDNEDYDNSGPDGLFTCASPEVVDRRACASFSSFRPVGCPRNDSDFYSATNDHNFRYARFSEFDRALYGLKGAPVPLVKQLFLKGFQKAAKQRVWRWSWIGRGSFGGDSCLVHGFATEIRKV